MQETEARRIEECRHASCHDASRRGISDRCLYAAAEVAEIAPIWNEEVIGQ